MSDPRPNGSAAAAVVGAIGSVVLLSIVVPAVIALFAALQSAPFFGEQPTAAELDRTSSGFWAAFAVSAVSLAIVVALAIASRGRRASAAVTVVAVVAGIAVFFWLAVAAGSVRAQPEAQPTNSAPSPTPTPTLVDGRFVPDATGVAAAETLIAQLRTVTFPADAGPGQVSRLITAVGGENPEVRGTEGDELVGVFVGHRACVLGTLRDGVATWSVAGLSDEGGCLGPVHA